MTYTAGIDVGSTYTKAVVIDADKRILGKAMTNTGFQLTKSARSALDEALAEAGLSSEGLAYTVATGFGRHQIPFADVTATDLTASARGVSTLFPRTHTILDVGGQTMKAIRLDDETKVKSFRLNDKCAAGTGAFLEKTARYLGLTTADIGPYALRSTDPKEVSSVCAVFAESEVINHLANGVPAEDIMMGAMVALGGRAVQLMRRVGLEPGYMLTGGMTHNAAMIKALEDNLKGKFNIAPDGLGQLNGAMGAALLGLRRVEKLLEEGKPIPPTAANLGTTDVPVRKRWSAMAVRKPAEPCTPGGDCPVVAKTVTLHPAGAAA